MINVYIRDFFDQITTYDYNYEVNFIFLFQIMFSEYMDTEKPLDSMAKKDEDKADDT